MSSRGPKCPNHDVGLLECKNGIGICPISGVQFSYTADEAKTKRVLNTAGKIVDKKEWVVVGDDS